MWLTISADPKLTAQMIFKGSITIDGISLTIADLQKDRFSVAGEKIGADPFQKAQGVRDKVARAVAEIPADAQPPVVERFDPDSAPILSVLFAGPRPIRSLTEVVDKQVKARLERISGVGSVENPVEEA